MNSFADAIRGILRAVKEERHLRVHLCFAFYVAAAGFVTKLDAVRWCIVLACIGAVISLELVNTALERACDAVTRERSPLIGAAKDACAGAVLAAAFFSAIIGCVIFFSDSRPEIAVQFARQSPIKAAALILALPLWIYFIAKPGRNNND